jgi:hypothetical protein
MVNSDVPSTGKGRKIRKKEKLIRKDSSRRDDTFFQNENCFEEKIAIEQL